MKISTLIYRGLIEVYKILPLKRYVCEVLRILPIDKKKFYLDVKFEGVFQVNFDSGESFSIYNHRTTIENEIFWKGIENGWERVSIGVWKELAKSAHVVMDIGANTGVYSLVTKAINPNSMVYAFEPSFSVYEKLKQNIKINGFDSIELHETAISNKNGEAIFYDFPTAHQYSASLNKNMISDEIEKLEVKVQTKRLDDFIREKDIRRLDLIKIDVESHEAEVLEGMRETIKSFKPTLLIEILDDQIGKAIEETLKSSDYLYFDIDEINPPQRVTKIKKSSHFNYLVCSEEVAKRLKLI